MRYRKQQRKEAHCSSEWGVRPIDVGPTLHEVDSKPAHAKPAYAAPKIILSLYVCATRLSEKERSRVHGELGQGEIRECQLLEGSHLRVRRLGHPA